MKTIQIALFCCCLTASLSANPDSLLAIQFRDSALHFLQQNAQADFKKYQEKALNIFKNQNNFREWIKVYEHCGHVYRDKLNLPLLAIEMFQMAAEKEVWRKPKTEREWIALAWIYVHIGYTYGQVLGRYKLGSEYYEKARLIFSQKSEREDELVAQYVYRELGNIYTRLGDISAAEVLLNQFKEISLKYENYSEAAEACSDLGILYLANEDNEKAIEVYQEALAYPSLNYTSKGLLHFNLGKVFVRTEEIQDALKELNRAKSIFEDKLDHSKFHKAEIWLAGVIIEIANVFSHNKQYEKAETYLNQGYKLFQDKFSDNSRREFAKLYSSYADLYLKWEKYDQALTYHQKSLQCILSDFQPANASVNPNSNLFYAENTITEALGGKAEVFAARFEESQDFNDLELALECHDLIFEVEKHLRRSYRYESSKLANVKESRERSEHAIDLALKLWKQTNDPKYKEKAFEFAERSKSILLMEAFRKTNAESVAGLPAEKLEEEKTFQANIALTEKRLFQAKSANWPDTVIQKIEGELLTLRQNYKVWIHEVEANHLQYYNLKYNFNTISVSEVQTYLGEEGALIEYFVGQEKLYAFVITKHAFEIVEQEKDYPLEDWIIELRKDIEQFQYSNSNRTLLCERYTQQAQKLYELLIAPLEELGLPEHLTIVPSSTLGFLPFDALLNAEPQQPCNFDSYPYLLRDYDISYAYSASLQAALYASQDTRVLFGGFAPEFSQSSDFGALHYNMESLEKIKKAIRGEIFTGPNATIANFINSAKDFDILQLATHAQANTEAGDFSFIVFADGKGGYDSLFVKDIYLLELAAELVVLSACETGVGTIHKGEGIISLARGFLYAGAKSILTSLWSINESTNLELIEAFYTKLRQGQIKGEALRNAKLDHLEDADRLYAHPVYWASLVPIGNMRVVYSKPSFSRYIAISVFLLIGLGLFYFFYAKGSKKRYGLNPFNLVIRNIPFLKQQF